MTPELWVNLAQGIGAILGGGGVIAVGRAMWRWWQRRPTRVVAHVQLNEATLQWATRLEESADRAWRRAEEAERKAETANERAEEADERADKAEQTARRVQSQILELSQYLDTVLRLIHDPAMTMDRLRDAVGNRPPHTRDPSS